MYDKCPSPNNLAQQQMAAEKRMVDTCNTGQAIAGIGYCPPTVREEAEKAVGYHREQADRSDRAAAFFRENPAFDEFIRLFRAGIIQL